MSPTPPAGPFSQPLPQPPPRFSRRELIPPFPCPVSREIQMFGPGSGAAQPGCAARCFLSPRAGCVLPGRGHRRGDGGPPVPAPRGEGASPPPPATHAALGGSFPSPRGCQLLFGVTASLLTQGNVGFGDVGCRGHLGHCRGSIPAGGGFAGTVPFQLGNGTGGGIGTVRGQLAPVPGGDGVWNVRSQLGAGSRGRSGAVQTNSRCTAGRSPGGAGQRPRGTEGHLPAPVVAAGGAQGEGALREWGQGTD